jgi:hypothetical protein
MERCKGKYILIKDCISRNINMTSSHIQTLDTFVECAISQKHTTCGSVSKISFVIGTMVWPTNTPKNPKRIIIWRSMKEALNESLIINNFARNKINKKCGCKEGFIPEF